MTSQRAEWDRLVLSREGGNLLQSWAWGELQSRFGWKVERIGSQASPAVYSLQKSSRGLLAGSTWYIPRGPLVAVQHVREVVADLLAQAGREKATALRIEPNAEPDQGWEEQLSALGLERGTAVQPEATQLLPIDRNEEELKARFKPKTRYNLNLALKKGVTVSRSEDLATFTRLSRETAARQGISLPGHDYYGALFQFLGADDGARLYLAHHEGIPLAGIIVVRFGEIATYLFGGSTSQHRELMPNYPLHWQAMLDFRQLGCTLYDWWGVAKDPSPDDPWFGLYRFKTGFGGQTVRYVGLYERVLRPGRHRLESALRKIVRRVRGGPILA